MAESDEVTPQILIQPIFYNCFILLMSVSAIIE